MYKYIVWAGAQFLTGAKYQQSGFKMYVVRYVFGGEGGEG
jgi:hypothetical protein